jgi:hypothetical protein
VARVLPVISAEALLATDHDAPTRDVEPAFARLAALTALRRSDSGKFFVSNYKRGHLLYTLIRRHRPSVVLELGTGRGYGALAMAMAASDANLTTQIFTLDVLAPSQPQHWALDEGNGPFVAERNINDVWGQLPSAWTARIHFLTGNSIDAMRRFLADRNNPPVEFAFIDGGHDYWTVRHDVLAALLAARGRAITLLLDDYGGVQGRDVRRLVDQTLAPRLAPGTLTLIEMPQSAVEFEDNAEHGMAYFDGRVMTLGPSLLAPTSLTGYGAHCVAARIERAALGARLRVARAVRNRRATQ